MASTKWLNRLPAIITVVVICGAVLLALYLKQLFFKEDVQQKKVVQQITVIAPPPPPPPPPPKEIEEPEIEEEVIEEQPDEPMPDDAPDESMGEELGIDAEGVAGADGFGLVGKKGGSGILGGGGYSSFVKTEVNKAIIRDAELRRLAYRAEITLWVADDGSFSRFEVELLEGSSAAKLVLERLLAELGGLSRPKPFEEQDNWFTFRITSVM